MSKTTTVQPDRNRCPKCSLKYWNDNKSTAPIAVCNCKKDNVDPDCWECIKCGRVNALWVATCSCYKDPSVLNNEKWNSEL